MAPGTAGETRTGFRPSPASQSERVLDHAESSQSEFKPRRACLRVCKGPDRSTAGGPGGSKCHGLVAVVPLGAKNFAFPVRLVHGPGLHETRGVGLGRRQGMFVNRVPCQLFEREQRWQSARHVAAPKGAQAVIENRDRDRRFEIKHSPGDQLTAGRRVARFQLEQIPPRDAPILEEPGGGPQQAAGQLIGHGFALTGGASRGSTLSWSKTWCAQVSPIS